MNAKNFDYLKDQVKFTGFGDALENELKGKMQKQSPEFQILHNAQFGNDSTVANLISRNQSKAICTFSTGMI